MSGLKVGSSIDDNSSKLIDKTLNLETIVLIRALKLKELKEKQKAAAKEILTTKKTPESIDPVAKKLEEMDGLSVSERAVLFSMEKKEIRDSEDKKKEK